MTEFRDRVALITGAGRGLGRAIALAFAARGARVAANDLTPVNLDQTLATIQEAKGTVRGYEADIGKKIPLQTMISQILEDWERIDILVNCASVDPRIALLDMDAWDWARTIEVNLTGPFLTTQSVGRVMKAVGGGVIVNIACDTDWASAQAGHSAFVASKAGLIGLTRAAAWELAPHQIRVNAICPAGKSQAEVAEVVLRICAPEDPTTGQILSASDRPDQSR